MVSTSSGKAAQGTRAARQAASDSGALKALEFPRPFTTVDVVIFTVLEDALKVLLVQRPSAPDEPFPSQWALPGGFVDVQRDADLQACAARKLQEKTSVESPYLEQLGSWGSATRDPRGWSATHVYFALIPGSECKLSQGANATDVAWVDVQTLLAPPSGRSSPKAHAAAGKAPLAFDHDEILRCAIDRLRGKVEYTSLPAFLLDEPFTLPQLQHVYEIVLGRPVDKSGFRTRMLAAQFLVEDGLVDGPSNRPAMGYRLAEPRQLVVFPRTFSPRG